MNEPNVTHTNNNYSEIYCKYWGRFSDVERAVQMAALSIIGGVGLFGNVFTIVLAVKYTVRRNLHFLIMNMAVSDTLVILCISFFFLVLRSNYVNVMKSWFESKVEILATIDCLMMTILHISQTVSLITLVMISIERYRITRRAIHMARPYSVKKRVSLIIGSWLISTVLNLNDAILVYTGKSGLCSLKPLHSLSVWQFAKVIIVFVMFQFLVLLSISTLRRLSRPQVVENNLSEAYRQLRKKRIGSAVKMVLYSLLLYCCCFLPLIVYATLQSSWFLFRFPTPAIILKTCYDWNALYFVTMIFLPITNSSFSPCVYFVFISDFRRAAKAVLCCRENTAEN